MGTGCGVGTSVAPGEGDGMECGTIWGLEHVRPRTDSCGAATRNVPFSIRIVNTLPISWLHGKAAMVHVSVV